MARKRKNSCLVNECGEPAACRGLCSADYQAARYAIEVNVTTEAELVEAGLMLPRYAKPRSQFREHLIDAKKRQRRKAKWTEVINSTESAAATAASLATATLMSA
jgi:hypothetical protein